MSKYRLAYLPFYGTNRAFPRSRRPLLRRMLREARPITRETFLQHVDPWELAGVEREYLGYTKGNRTSASDPEIVHYSHRGVYFFEKDAICYFFATEEQVAQGDQEQSC